MVQRSVRDVSGKLEGPAPESKVRLPKWIYVLREMDKGRSTGSIAEDLSHT